ncbi:MAG: peptidylprolyl isomerase [Verrucomicrobiota bacterium]
MLTFLARKFKFLLVVVLVIIGISFIFFGSWTPKGDVRGMEALSIIEGQKISYEHFADAEKAMRVMFTFRTGQVLNPKGEEEARLVKQTWIRLLFLTAAREANLQVSDQEMIEAVKQNPFFQEKGTYSPVMFQKFFQFFLAPQGLTVEHFHDFLRQELMIQSFARQIQSTAIAMPEEIENSAKRFFGKAETAMVLFSIEEEKNKIQPTPEELKAFYEKNSERYATREERKVEFVEFRLSDAEKKIDESKRKEAMKKLGEKAFDFAGRFLDSEQAVAKPENFKNLAEEMHLPVRTSDWLSVHTVALPPYGNQPQLIRAIFDLSAANPISDYLPIENGFVVFHLLEAHPSRVRTFEEAGKDIRGDYIQQRSAEWIQQRAATFRKEALKKLSAGATWEKVISELNVKSVSIPSFIPAESENLKMEFGNLVRVLAYQLNTGELSQFVPTEKGGMMVYVKNRTPSDQSQQPAMLAKVAEAVLEQRQQAIVNDWLISRLLSPRTQLPKELIQNWDRL